MSKIEIILGDITNQKFDVIINAANESLYRGGGVCGAIYAAAGDRLEEECLSLSGCKTGEAKLTRSYNLREAGIGWIIHAVGPRWRGGVYNEDELLRKAYLNSLKLAVNYRDIYPEQCKMAYLNFIETSGDEDKIVEEAKEYVLNNPIKSIAFPSISTGIYGFPLKRGAKIAIATINNFLKENNELEKVAMVLFNRGAYDCYMNEVGKYDE